MQARPCGTHLGAHSHAHSIWHLTLGKHGLNELEKKAVMKRGEPQPKRHEAMVKVRNWDVITWHTSPPPTNGGSVTAEAETLPRRRSLVWILKSRDGKAVRGSEESRKWVSSKWLKDLEMLKAEKKNLRENMITVFSQVHSLFLSCFISFKFWPKCHFHSTMTTLVKTVSSLTSILTAPKMPSLLYFYSIYHLFIYCIVFLFILFIVFSPQNCKPGQRKFGCFGHLCVQHQEQRLPRVVSTHLLTA